MPLEKLLELIDSNVNHFDYDCEVAHLQKCMQENRPYFGNLWKTAPSPLSSGLCAASCLKLLPSKEAVNVLEIGAFCGFSTVSIAYGLEMRHGNAKGTICSCDLFRDASPASLARPGHALTDPSSRNLNGYLKWDWFSWNVSNAKAKASVHPFVGRSQDMLAFLQEDSFDLILLAGARDYLSSSHDMEKAKRLIRCGGIICGEGLAAQPSEIDMGFLKAELTKSKIPPQRVDDPRSGKSCDCPGVLLAVSELFGNLAPQHGSFWCVRKTASGFEPIVVDIDMEIFRRLSPSLCKLPNGKYQDLPSSVYGNVRKQAGKSLAEGTEGKAAAAKTPLFSVVINNYNYAKYLGKAIESVLAQTLQDFELIVVDDGSTDSSRDLILSFSDERIVKVFKENGGQASALNAGFEKARGEYVAFMDSDDLFDANKLEELLKAFSNSQCSLVQHQLRVIDKDGRETGQLFPPLKAGETDILPLYFRHRSTSFFSATSGIAAQRRTLRRIFPLPEEDWRICADVPLTRPLPVFGKALSIKPVGSYRIHGGNNWMNTEERHAKAQAIVAKNHKFTNEFLRRWGIFEQIRIPLPTSFIISRGIRVAALYGAGEHTRYLLECQGLPGGLTARAILDDAPSDDAIAGVPVCSSANFDPASCDALVISSDAFESTLTRKALSLGFPNVLPLYSVEQFRKNKAAHIARLVEQLRLKGKKRVALYGAGVHTLNLLLSQLLPEDIETTCIIDEAPAAKTLWGVPILRPKEADSSKFDAIVLSSDTYERQMFYQARDYGFGSIFLIYGAVSALKGNRADFEDIRRKLASGKPRKIAVYDPCWFTQCLLQSGYLGDSKAICVLAEADSPAKAIFDAPVLDWRKAALPDFDLLAIPPRVPKEVANELKARFREKALTITVNPDEIDLIHEFLGKRAETPTMLDVGANVGNALQPFAKDGWRVYAFEPDSAHRKNLEKACAQFPKVSISPFALSNAVTSKVPLYRSKVSGGISGLSVFHRSHYLAEYVSTTLLSMFVKENCVREADFMKVDTEGYDLFVLQGNDWEAFRPRIVMCEFENHKTVPLGYDFNGIAGYLQAQGYSLLISEWDPLIEYGNQPRWRRFASYPCALLDPAGAGNIFAFAKREDLQSFIAEIEKAWPLEFSLEGKSPQLPDGRARLPDGSSTSQKRPE